MARFRADFSDSSDEEPSPEPETRPQDEPPSEDESESESESSRSPSPEMQEDELLTSPVRRRKRPKENALVEDEDGEIRYAHEVDVVRETDVRVSPASSSASPPPPRIRGDPTIIPWAQHIGVDAQKMHVMQTSLFRMPEEAAALRALDQPARTNLRVPLQPLNRKHSRDSDGDGLRIDSRERASFAHDIEPPVYRPSRKYARVETSESAVKGNEGAVFDAGLAFGRSFRVGWGPGGTLVHLGTLCGPSSTPKTTANSSTVFKTTVPLFSNATQGSSLAAKLLQHHLSNSPIGPDDDGIPFAAPNPRALHFSSFVSLFPTADRSYEASLFRLGHALFDDIDLRLGESITIDIQNRIAAVRRKAGLSAWLEDAVTPAVEAELRSNTSADAPTVAFTLLTGNQIEKAVNVAMDGGYLNLATLISQSGGDWEYREDLKEQLRIWRDERIDAHIDDSVRRLYALLAGVVDTVVEGSRGGGLEKCADVDVLKGLDWKRVFGVHLWFSEPVDAPIAQVFQAYDQLARSAGQRQVARPLPWYMEKPATLPRSLWKLPSPSTFSTSDGLYSLIRLHAEPACSLSQVLTPLSFSASPVDYSLPWHLYIILSRCMRVRDFADRGEPVGHGRRMDDTFSVEDESDEDKPEGHSPSADLLASSYALQLESQGMIQEALFVLLHIEGPRGREKAVKDLLARSAPKLDEWMTRGIVGSLKIPMAWVEEAKAIYALDCGEIYEAYELFISAGLYNAAHDIAVLELAPDAVIRRDYGLLRSLFIRIDGRPGVEGWNVRGKIFMDYAHIMTRLPELADQQLKDAVPDASQNTEIDTLTRSVPRIIGILPDVLRDTSNPRHTAALAEMVSSMVAQVDKLRPLALSQVPPSLMEEATRLGHIQSMAYARTWTLEGCNCTISPISKAAPVDHLS
ncbi:putative nuclear protein 96 [Lyophyllum shimeji]|uniref:Nuclear protein 96 n=1 Tax=Lyophyllum shimeji TaxID=47721 RepID=A0A9P3PUE2_LYOSH|nr:putative nuclear protein 96 [Lyophyllum shimeji]